MIRKKSTRAAEIAFADEVMASDEFAALPERVRSTVRNHRQGMRGERETAYMLDHQFGPDNDRNLLIHDLRLPDGQGGFAQFDHILLSRASRTASIFRSRTTLAGSRRTSMANGWSGIARNVSRRTSPIRSNRPNDNARCCRRG